MEPDGIQLTKSQQQARHLQRLHDEERSFLKNGYENNNGYEENNDYDDDYNYHHQTTSDVAVLSTAWSRLSCPTRFLLLILFGTSAMYAVYTLGVTEGVREEHHQLGVTSNDNNEETFTGKQANEHYLQLSHAFTPALLKATRAAAKKLIGTLEEYYGGEEKAKDMLMRSWQAGWELDGELFLSGDEGVSNEDGTFVKSEQQQQQQQQDATDDDEKLTKREKRQKKHKNNGSNNNRDLKKTKTVKALNDPKDMNAQQKLRWEQSKRERVTKLITTMARALLNPNQVNFMIGTIGSSVAAGHDNCHYDCYESQLERTLQEVFEAAGMKLIVQNAGEGGSCGDSHENQVFCITHNVSPNVDIIHYSWTYFEKGGAEIHRESLIRWGQKMQHRPMVHHLVARGKSNTCEADVEANVKLDDRYAKAGYNAFCIQTGLYAGGHDYATEEEMGINRFGWRYVGDGYHNTTRYGELLPDDDPRKESLGTVFRNWHPGPLGFQVAADAFAYVYANGVLMALDIIEADMNSGLSILDRWFDSSHRRRTTDERSHDDRELTQRSLFQLPPHEDFGDPLYCDPLHCSISVPPSCLNYEKPTFGTAGIQVKDQAGWDIWHEDNKWSNMVGKVDTAIFKAKNDPEWFKKCKHLDACGGIFASEASHGELVFELPSTKMDSGIVIVCGCCGKKVGESMFLQNVKVTIKINGRELDKSTMEVWPNLKCVRLTNGFGVDGFEKEDEMLLSFELNGKQPEVKVIGDVEEATEVKISHVIAL